MRSSFQRDDEPLEWARSALRTKRLWIATIFGNALLFGLMIGVPYARGLFRAEQMRRGYAQAASCLLGGSPVENPGLGRFDDEAGRLATSLLSRDETWLKRCDRALSVLAPSPAIFVWPPAKEGEARVREAVQILRHELSAVAKLKRYDPIPTRALRALEQLDDMLRQHAVLTAALNIPPQDAVRFHHAPAQPTPARLPLYAGVDAVITLWGNDSELHAVGVDRTGLSYLHTDHDRLDRARHARPKLLRAFLRIGNESYLAYAVNETKCRERVGGCAGKAMGLARATLPLTTLPQGRWLASHPHGRPDLSIRHTNAGWWLSAATPDGRAELRALKLSSELGGEAETNLPPAPLSVPPQPASGSLVFVDAPYAPRVWGTGVREGSAVLFSAAGTGVQEPATDRAVLASIPDATTAWAVSCAGPKGSGFVLGSDHGLVLGNVDAGSTRVWNPVALAIEKPFHERDPDKDAVVRICSSIGALAFARDAEKRLWSVRCMPTSDTCVLDRVAEHVSNFAVSQTAKSIVVAYAGSDRYAQIRIQRYDTNGKAQGTTIVPSACWSPQGGMCGQPHLARLGTRLVLAAREGTYLLVLESPDEGEHWQPLAHDGQLHL